MTTKQEIFREKLSEYLVAGKEEKGRILDSVCDITGVNRKSAIRRFRTLQLRDKSHLDHRGRKKIYNHLVVSALKTIWEAANRICAERLHPIIPEYIRVLTRDDMWRHDLEISNLLLRMSLGTAKNCIAKFENIKKRGGFGTTKPSDLKEVIPIRRGPWQNPPPGKGEIDTIAHCGHTLSGDFCYTVQYTDIATIWMCLSAQWNKGEEETRKSIELIKSRLPFPLLAIDPDSGSEFINWHLKGWCDRHHIDMTRTRPYMKNDHARIEQKNYTNVRRIVGYRRFDDPQCVIILNELYEVLEDYINFFIPSVKCIEKIRADHSRTKRVYDGAMTAYERVLRHDKISPETKEKLRQKYARLNPIQLKQKCDRIIARLAKIRPRLR